MNILSSARRSIRHLAALAAVCALCAAPASTQTAAAQNAAGGPGSKDVTNPTPAIAADASTEAEQTVQALLKEDGTHVVHFWAPWCPNAKNELGAGWGDLIRNNEDVSFVFVTIWNDGEDGASVLSQYDIPDRVTTLTLPDTGPSDDEDKRRREFLGLPFTWSPSTWIFHENGELAFAMNYGEMKMSTVQTLIDNTQADW